MIQAYHDNIARCSQTCLGSSQKPEIKNNMKLKLEQLAKLTKTALFAAKPQEQW